VIQLIFPEDCAVSLCGWSKLQIAHCSIKINSNILMVGLIYKSLT
jgi:hypothetical protein